MGLCVSARLVNLACAHFFFCICVGQGEAAVAARQQPSRAAAVIVRSTVSFCSSCCCWFYSLLSSLCLLLFCSFCWVCSFIARNLFAISGIKRCQQDINTHTHIPMCELGLLSVLVCVCFAIHVQLMQPPLTLANLPISFARQLSLSIAQTHTHTHARAFTPLFISVFW